MTETDYLIVGAGAMAMAFADVILTESDATVTLVDRRGRPGGHWNDAYPFVRLHQPSAFYGVNSRHLGTDTKDATGWNAGLFELASAAEVLAYFDHVLHQQFLPTGRVQYFPMAEYLGDGRFKSLVSGHEQQVTVRRKVVDATYMNVTVPAMRPPAYEVAEGVRCIPLNELPKVTEAPERYVIVGAGKTAMDAVLWLLANQVDPNEITWIMPRDSWMLDRAKIQPSAEFVPAVLENFARSTEACAAADSIHDLFARLERDGALLRLDTNVEPTMYRCATVTRDELAQMQRVTDVVRLGRVAKIGPDQITLEGGRIPTRAGALHVDCTADGLARRPVAPVFDGDHISLQAVRTCQQVFSAAFIGHVEVAYEGDELKNELATVVPHPNTDVDWLRSTLANSLNSVRWRQDAELTAWLRDARLDAFTELRTGTSPDPEVLTKLGRVVEAMPGAIANLQGLIAQAEA